MRLYNNDSSNWSDEIRSCLKNVEVTFSEGIKNAYTIEDGYISHKVIKVYKDHRVTEALEVTVVFTIHLGKGFKETISYSLYSDLELDFIIFKKGYGADKKMYKKSELSVIKDFIIKDVYVSKGFSVDEFKNIN